MFVTIKEYEVARERHQDDIRHAQEENRKRAMTAGIRFGRTTNRTVLSTSTERVSGFIRHQVRLWMVAVSGGGQRRYVQ